jgi:hypothetical protein
VSGAFEAHNSAGKSDAVLRTNQDVPIMGKSRDKNAKGARPVLQGLRPIGTDPKLTKRH